MKNRLSLFLHEPHRGVMLMIVMVIIVAVGLAAGISMDMYVSKIAQQEEYNYEMQLHKIKRAVHRVLYNIEWDVLINNDPETQDKTLYRNIPSYYTTPTFINWSETPNVSADYPIMAYFNIENNQIYFGNPDIMGTHYNDFSSNYMDNKASYRINTIKFLRRLCRLGFLSMSEEEISWPKTFGNAGKIINGKLKVPVWCAGDLKDL